MRSMIIALTAFAALIGAPILAPPASAAPTCQNERGGAARCNTPGAMPLGWVMPEEQRERLAQTEPPFSVLEALPGLLFVVAFIAIFALMPEFDGSKDSDWLSKPSRKRRR